MTNRGSIHDFLERTRLPLILIVLFPIAAVLFLVFGQQLSQNGPAPVPEASPVPQAKIALDSPRSLPQSVKAAQLVPFSFTIQNPSSSATQYQYKVSVRWSTGEKDVIDVNTLPLAAGASASIREQLKFEVATETAQVALQLPQTGQSLEFTLPIKQ